jgi:hypothetical protein
VYPIQRVRELLPEGHKQQQADNEENYGLGRPRGKIVLPQAGDLAAVPNNEHDQHRGQNRQEDPKKPAHRVVLR